MKLGNEALNPGAQLVHPTPIAKVSLVALAPFCLNATEAIVDLQLQARCHHLPDASKMRQVWLVWKTSAQ